MGWEISGERDRQWRPLCRNFCFLNDHATTDIYTLSLHDALPICRACPSARAARGRRPWPHPSWWADRKSTRLNSSHVEISYAVSCLKKKKIGKPLDGQIYRQE